MQPKPSSSTLGYCTVAAELSACKPSALGSPALARLCMAQLPFSVCALSCLSSAPRLCSIRFSFSAEFPISCDRLVVCRTDAAPSPLFSSDRCRLSVASAPSTTTTTLHTRLCPPPVSSGPTPDSIWSALLHLAQSVVFEISLCLLLPASPTLPPSGLQPAQSLVQSSEPAVASRTASPLCLTTVTVHPALPPSVRPTTASVVVLPAPH